MSSRQVSASHAVRRSFALWYRGITTADIVSKYNQRPGPKRACEEGHVNKHYSFKKRDIVRDSIAQRRAKGHVFKHLSIYLKIRAYENNNGGGEYVYPDSRTKSHYYPDSRTKSHYYPDSQTKSYY
jgi:hypothetical protein